MPAPRISFEVFPPKSLPSSFQLWDTANRLEAFCPEFTSVTYGAQGADKGRTLDAVKALTDLSDHPVAAHVTALGTSKTDVEDLAHTYSECGIRHIVALRGDAPKEGRTQDEYSDSLALTRVLAKRGNFDISVGAHPNGHPDAASEAQNIDWLKAKLDAGATQAITQFFFEPDTFLRFRDACRTAGITAPIIPGVLPIHDWALTKNFARKCGIAIPEWLESAFAVAQRDGRDALLSLAVTTELCSKLVQEGEDHLHIYTLNRAPLAEALCRALGKEPTRPALRNVA
ncbi:MAG: methylenetetrahydrofolate reductase [Pseudomonadota bacterium]